jgi:uncharacterized protein YndB with AHSA1/START domain
MYTPDNHLFIISHLFHAPMERVWSVWTEEEHLRHWFGPKGSAVTPLRMELWPGGIFHYRMTSPDGQQMWGKWSYVEVIPQKKLVAVVSFTDAEGGITRHPLNTNWPLETFSVIEFRGQGEKSLVTVEWSPYRASEEEIATFDASHTDMTQGWRGTFDQLDEYLEQMAPDPAK